MSKVYKATIYYTDTMDQIDGKEGFKSELEMAMERSYLGRAGLITDVEESREFEWDDDIDLNRIDTEREVYDKYFKEETEEDRLFEYWRGI
ncbi:hypothetical protein [Vagococcus fluvialis]|uniref:hypothetical protein n=1 Tax=Vagococcus fluvialis TaxID=2738 RepID=UPI001D0B2269|nr:hypothetical protein [Vagococcus fluvialis]UDM72641.1 hypothetical protein K5L00_14735 [Vagococcus fluvialis]UDM78364.1 hypothetical protein K5K98_14940 [Vagococcus fluvialis]UDM83916.1 hypothetical protein K5K96_14760 [Vagococcus fluvialis]